MTRSQTKEVLTSSTKYHNTTKLPLCQEGVSIFISVLGLDTLLFEHAFPNFAVDLQ